MKWPWKRLAEAKAQVIEAEAQAVQAEQNFKSTMRVQHRVSESLAALFYQAHQNRIVENIQKVARGQ